MVWARTNIPAKLTVRAKGGAGGSGGGDPEGVAGLVVTEGASHDTLASSSDDGGDFVWEGGCDFVWKGGSGFVWDSWSLAPALVGRCAVI